MPSAPHPIRIGTQGWNYADWLGPFYPRGAQQKDWLGIYARAFDVVEVDSTFYAVPAEERFVSWRERTPDDFTFALKLPGEVTHNERLRGDGVVLLEFCRNATLLGDRLGPLLIQLPPDFHPDERPALEQFLARLPGGFDFAIEFRDAAWLEPGTFDALERFGVAQALSIGPWLDTDSAIAAARDVPGEFLYLRWIGAPRAGMPVAEAIAERDREIERWAAAIRDAARERAVFAFFNNDYQGHAPRSARRLQALLGMPVVMPEDLRAQGELFG
jgi:uncharacterized protein YecE (DUF72 family)